MGRIYKFPRILYAIGLCIGMSLGDGYCDSFDCTKFNHVFCAELKAVTSDTIKIPVSIFLPWPELDSVCKTGGVPRPDTNGICRYDFEDSAYVEMLREANSDMFNSYELWNGDNPSQRLQEPEEPSESFNNVLATKATILRLSEEEYVATIERYRKYEPLGARTSKVRPNSFKAEGNSYLINGQRQGKVPARTPGLIRPHHTGRQSSEAAQ